MHSQPLPPNYLFAPGASDYDDLTQLDILITGPTHTPFVAGVWKLHLSIPATYPQQPPTANFRTSIFHPNVDPQTGGVCVETLKRDWDSKLTLRDVLITMSCLLIQPNPDSALNAEAGSLIQENYEAFAKRAELMTSIHAAIPKSLQAAVKEAQNRGQAHDEAELDRGEAASPLGAPVRRRRGATARQRGTATSRRSEGSPTGGLARRRQQAGPSQPLILHNDDDDIFGASQVQSQHTDEADDSSVNDANQENDESKSPTKTHAPKATTPRRPLGISTPLGELILDDVASASSDDDDMEPEYPPSPRKSPVKSPRKQRQPIFNDSIADRPESSRTAALRAPNITPPTNLETRPLAEDSPFANIDATPSPRKARLAPQPTNLFQAAPARPLFKPLTTPRTPLEDLSTSKSGGGIFKKRSPSSSEKKREEAKRKAELNARLWELCGRDIRKWNRGEFGGEVFQVKARRW